MDRTVNRMKDHYIICGYGEVGRAVADAVAQDVDGAAAADLALEAGEELAAPGAVDPAALRAAIEDLVVTFGERYSHGREYLARLAALAERR